MNTRTPRRKRRKRQDTIGLIAGWILLALALALPFYLLIASDRSTYEYTDTTLYWVEQGDTLWKIARDYSTDRQDVRRVIDIIEDLNDCTATIYPGQCLTVPVFYK